MNQVKEKITELFDNLADQKPVLEALQHNASINDFRVASIITSYFPYDTKMQEAVYLAMKTFAMSAKNNKGLRNNDKGVSIFRVLNTTKDDTTIRHINQLISGANIQVAQQVLPYLGYKIAYNAPINFTKLTLELFWLQGTSHSIRNTVMNWASDFAN